MGKGQALRKGLKVQWPWERAYRAAILTEAPMKRLFVSTHQLKLVALFSEQSGHVLCMVNSLAMCPSFFVARPFLSSREYWEALPKGFQLGLAKGLSSIFHEQMEKKKATATKQQCCHFWGG